jgi:hypothetical protein
MKRYAVPAVLSGVTLAVTLGVCGVLSSPASRAQTPPPSSEALAQKVDQLEKQVAELQAQIEELKRRPAPQTVLVPHMPLQAQPSYPNLLPPGAQPFTFNGGTYYWTPITQQQPSVTAPLTNSDGR